MHEREVLLLDRAARELAYERAVGLVVLGHHEQPGGAAIEAVDDAGAQHAADARQVVHPGEQRVHERAARGAGRGVDHEAGGLVDHQQRSVLVHHPQRDVLGLGLGRSRGGDAHGAVWPAFTRAAARAGAPSSRTWPASISAWRRERESAGAAGEPGVEAQAGLVRCDDQLGGPLPPQAAAIPWLRLTRGSSSAAPRSSTSAISCEVDTTPPSQEPRSGSPRRNSSANRAAE